MGLTSEQIWKRYFGLIARYGTEDEREDAAETLTLMRDVRAAAGEGARWDPLDEMALPEFFCRKAEREAKVRHARALDYRLRNQYALVRSLEEEIRVTKAQFAAAIMLGVPWGELPANHAAGRAHGNLGENRSVLAPKEGNFGVLVTPDEKPTRNLFVVMTDSTRLKLIGWCRAGEMMRKEFVRPMTRRNEKGEWVETRPFIGPTSLLLPLRAWFDR